MTDSPGHNAPANKKKRKRSQIQMAKKFARRRNHGSNVDSDTYQYMVRVLELIRGDFPSSEEKQIFVKNVYKETVGHELEYARNQVGSRVLDSLMEYADLDCIERLLEALTSALRALSCDTFASHVLQKILLVSTTRGLKVAKNNESRGADTKEAVADVKPEERTAYQGIVLKMSRYFLNNLEEFVFDKYANHLVRTAIESLGGLARHGSGSRQQESDRFVVPPTFKELLLESSKRLLRWPQFPEFGQDELTSGLLQSVLYSTKGVDSSVTEAYVDRITKDCFRTDTNIFESQPSARLVEACLSVASGESFKEIFRKFFASRLQRLSSTPGGNFSVQRLLEHCPTKEDFDEIYDELCPALPEIFASGYVGVLSNIGSACLRLRTKQGPWLKDVTALLHCEQTSESQIDVLRCLVCLKTKEELAQLCASKSPSVLPIVLHGSLMVQDILKFNKPIKLVNSLLEWNSEDLVKLFNDPRGSRIVDAFMESAFIGEKSREKLVKKLKGYWAELASNTHGSRCFERIWDWARGNQRELMMDELAEAGEALRSTKAGRIVSGKMNVPLYARNKKDWRAAQGKEEKTRTLFANIIQSASG